MTIDELRKAQRAVPFRPFKIHLADGQAIEVPHPEYLMLPPRGFRTMAVWDKRDRAHSILDALLVTRIEFEAEASASA